MIDSIIEIGKITGAVGIKGYLKVNIYLTKVNLISKLGPVLLENKAVIYVSFSTDSSFIKSLDFIYDSFNLELFNIKYSILDLDSTHVFKIDAPNAFILDLRD